jgi:biopolymer transport protein ExbD
VREEIIASEMKSIFDREPDRLIRVKGDRKVEYGRVLKVMRACRDAGFTDIGLIAQSEKTAGGGKGD